MTWKQRIESLINGGHRLEDIAAAMGVTPNAIREILKDRTSAPRAEAAIKLLALYESQHQVRKAA